MPVNLLDYDLQQLTVFCSEIGGRPFRAKQLLRWIHHFGESDFAKMSDLAKSMREKLAAHAVIEPPKVKSDSLSADGTRKWLLEVGKGNAVEAVYIPEGDRGVWNWGAACGAAMEREASDPAAARVPSARPSRRYRGTLCISTQAGCALECTFCSTGRQGFNRNLSVAEIIGQLWWANKALGHDPNSPRIISNVVLMGMGEPLLNFDNVVTALRLMLDDHAYGLSRRRVTLSTSGVVPAIERLREACPVALAVSLHAPNDRLRDLLVPINRKYPLRELLAACRRYLTAAPRDFITFEYVMLEGVNDSVAQARELVALVRDVPCKFNLIPFNSFPDSGYRRSSPQAIAHFREVLAEAGLVVTTRKTRGDDIDAACGQLAGEVQDRTKRKLRRTAAMGNSL